MRCDAPHSAFESAPLDHQVPWRRARAKTGYAPTILSACQAHEQLRAPRRANDSSKLQQKLATSLLLARIRVRRMAMAFRRPPGPRSRIARCGYKALSAFTDTWPMGQAKLETAKLWERNRQKGNSA
ncbi:hypothetical protein FDECE_16642 [Fusarium decemcellulare]|nr:hypothetical protein FDECE_16642 [Fusarium decemcellulare]